MRRTFLILLLINMALFQTAGTGMIRESSRHLVVQQHIALGEGYGPLPDACRKAELTSWCSALAAGLFYALSLGMGLTVLETTCIAVMTHIFISLVRLSAVYSIPALLLLLYVGNVSTPAIWTTGAFFISLMATLGLMLREQRKKRFKAAFSFRPHSLLVPVIIAMIIIIAYMSGVRDFVAVRDLFTPAA